MASKPSHQLSMNFWLNTLVDIKIKKKKNWSHLKCLETITLIKAWQSEWIIYVVSFMRCKMKINSNELNAQYAEITSPC